jgi:hypothetical protein
MRTAIRRTADPAVDNLDVRSVFSGGEIMGQDLRTPWRLPSPSSLS